MNTKLNSSIDFLYKNLGQKILKFLLKRNGGDLEVAEAVLQDAFVATYQSFHTFHSKSTYFTWICKIALNKLSDYYRDQVRHRSKIIVPLSEEINKIIDPDISPEEKLALDELKTRVNRCLDLLPKEYRQLLHLRYYEELSLRQISLKLHLNPRSVEGKMYRAKKHLAKIYAESS